MRSGGYDNGYLSSDCFWGTKPGSLVLRFVGDRRELAGLRVLDAGCGEGKNAMYLANLGASVVALDVSRIAIERALERHGGDDRIVFMQADIAALDLTPGQFDLVISYGLTHCLASREEVHEVVRKLKAATREGGANILCAFNDRYQDLSAHPGFHPTLMTHAEYQSMYADWRIETSSDTDLHEVHPHNQIPHVHSMTRMIANKPSR